MPEKLLEGCAVGEEVMTGEEVVEHSAGGQQGPLNSATRDGIKLHTEMGEGLSRG